MEYGVFRKDPVMTILRENLVEARLHTDGEKNIERIRELQQRFVGHGGLPVYLVIDPETEKVSGEMQRIERDVGKFASFLEKALGS